MRMTIGILKLALFIPDANSLKEKRMILHSLKARLRNNFNVAVTQVGGEDKWQRSTLAIAGVEADRRRMNSVLDGVVNFVGESHLVTVMDHEIELL